MWPCGSIRFSSRPPAKSILLSAAVRLSAFILPQITRITSRDDMELGLMGERKQAVFAIIPDNDGTFNYLVGMLYTCAFQALYYQADKVHQGALPVPVRLMMDDSATSPCRMTLASPGHHALPQHHVHHCTPKHFRPQGPVQG